MNSQVNRMVIARNHGKPVRTVALPFGSSPLPRRTFIKRKRPIRTHTPDQSERGYTIISVDSNLYLASYGGNVKRGDYLRLGSGQYVVRYQVQEIDYYNDPPDLWIALLKPSTSKAVDRRFWMGPATQNLST